MDHGLGEVEVLQGDRLAGITQGVAGAGVLDADAGGDVAGEDGVFVDTIVGVHLEDAAHPLLVGGAGVEDLIALVELARVHPEVGEAADVGVGHDLECQRRERLGVVGLALVGLTGAGVLTLDRRHVERRRQEVDNGVEQGLDALVLERRAVEDRHEAVVQRAVAHGSLDLVLGDLFVLEHLHHEVLVEVGERVEQLRAIHLGVVDEFGRNVDLVPAGAEIFALPHERLHLHEVDEAGVLALRPDRQLEHGDVLGEALLDRAEHEVEVGAGAVHLVDEAHARHVVAISLTPDRLGLRLHAGHTVEHGDSAVEHTKRTLHLDGEVDVARGVDDVDAVVVPDAVRGSGGDRDATLLLLLHPVHRGGAVVDLTDLVGTTGVVEDALGGGGLTGVNVRHDPDVAGLGEGGSLLSHGSGSSSGGNGSVRGHTTTGPLQLKLIARS